MSAQKAATGNAIPHLAAKVRRAYTNHMNRSFSSAGFNVTTEQFVVMMILRQFGELSQQQIAARSNRDKTSVTRLLNNLEKKELICRRCGPDDKRQKLICLTDDGADLMESLIQITEKDAPNTENGLTPEELLICKKVLNKIYINLTEVKDA